MGGVDEILTTLGGWIGDQLADAVAPPKPADAPEQDFSIEHLQGFLDSIGSRGGPALILDWPAASRLSHYTDLPGLIGIIENNDLWLTHARYSNDDEETTHGYGIVRKVLVEELKKQNDPVRKSYLEAIAKHVESASSDSLFICCFCEQDNLLSQWRSYGANGTGVSIQLAANKFSDRTGADFAQKHGLLRLWKVFYDEKTQKSIVKDALDFPLATWPGFPVEVNAKRATEAIKFFIPTFKKPDFDEEKEWRLIFTPAPGCPVKPRFRVRRQMLVPYYSLSELTGGGDLPLSEVCVGPGPVKPLNATSVRLLLAQHGYGDVKVWESTTPYRGQ